jgi:hypothetical protein
MRYMLLIYMEEGAIDETARRECYEESARVAHEMGSRYLAAAPLQPVSTATSVKVRDGRSLVTDGPFAETREQLAGYFLVEAADLDEAIGLAGSLPGARWGTVEVRPVIDVPGLPD